MKLIFSFAGIGLFLGLGIQTYLYPDTTGLYFAKSSYFILMLMVTTWLYSAIKFLQAQNVTVTTFGKKYWENIVLALILTAIIFWGADVKFKTLSDETNLLAVSKSMFIDKSIYNTTMGKFYYQNFYGENFEIPTRPLLFPFFTSLVHAILNFRIGNVFLLNAMVMVSFFLLLGVAIRRFLGKTSSYAVVFAAASYPVFAVYGTGGGFDLFSTVFFMTSMIGAYVFLTKPTSENFAFLWMNLLLFSNIRYESIILLGFIPFMLFLMRKISLNTIKENIVYFSLTPLFLIITIWQRYLSQGKYENPKDVPVLSVGKFIEHLGIFLKEQINFQFFLPYNNILNLLSVVFVLFLIYKALKKEFKFSSSIERNFVIIFVGSIVICTAIFLSHHFGVYSHPTQARFFMVTCLAFILLPFFIKYHFPKVLRDSALLLYSVMMFFMYNPITAEGRFINTLIIIRETDYCLDFLKRNNSPNVLVVVDRPGQYTAVNYGSVTFQRANEQSQQLIGELSRHLFSDIFVFQKISYETQKATQDTAISDKYKLETLEETQLTASEYLRISRVIAP